MTWFSLTSVCEEWGAEFLGGAAEPVCGLVETAKISKAASNVREKAGKCSEQKQRPRTPGCGRVAGPKCLTVQGWGLGPL